MDGLTGVPSGFTKLDEMTSGWQRGELIIIAGYPGMGKTSFALSVAKNTAVDQRIPVAFFSLEMTNVKMVNRLISNTCEIEGKKVVNGQLDNAEWNRLDMNIKKLDVAPLFIDDTPGLSVFELKTKARQLVREKKVEVIIIDYLQLMKADGVIFGNRQEEVSAISHSLKSLAKELDIPVLALSQLNLPVEQQGNINKADRNRPRLSDIRESRAIEQDADLVLFVHRPEYYHNCHDENGNDLKDMAQIIIAKNIKGTIGDVLLHFRSEYSRFSNPENTDNSPISDAD